MITLDTSGLIARISKEDRYNAACRAVLEEDSGPYVIPAAILAEITWMLETMFPPVVEQAFLGDLREGAYAVDWDLRDMGRVEQLIQKYRDLDLGFADAAVIACAERHRGRVLATDFRHFPVVARGERTITVLPQSPHSF